MPTTTNEISKLPKNLKCRAGVVISEKQVQKSGTEARYFLSMCDKRLLSLQCPGAAQL
jgi:hypothetical protein